MPKTILTEQDKSAELQNQIDTKQDKITGAANTITNSDLSSNMVLVSDGNGKVAEGNVTSTELDYLIGVTSSVQTQLTTATNIATNASTKAVTALEVAQGAQGIAEAALPLAGGTMTGSLILSGDPEESLEAATKQYVDNYLGAQEGWSDWGNEDAVGDSTWWADLKAWATDSSTTADMRVACVGKTKKVTLTTTLLGTTTHSVRCIGADQDGIGTLTFQTTNCLDTYAVFSSSSAVWIGSNARTQCQNYYNYFPGKASIKTISKGTVADQNSSRAGSVTYNNETVFIPSEREMGLDTYSSLSATNSTTTAAECTYGYNESYSYYTSSTARVKKKGDSGSSCYYWERSRDYSNASLVCSVSSSGAAYHGSYSGTSIALAPAFVIG